MQTLSIEKRYPCFICQEEIGAFGTIVTLKNWKGEVLSEHRYHYWCYQAEQEREAVIDIIGEDYLERLEEKGFKVIAINPKADE